MRVPPLSPVSVDSSAALSGWEESWDSEGALGVMEVSQLSSAALELEEGVELSGWDDTVELVFAPPEQAVKVKDSSRAAAESNSRFMIHHPFVFFFYDTGCLFPCKILRFHRFP